MTTTTNTCTAETPVCEGRVTSKNNAQALLGAMGYKDVCAACYEYWGWENGHSDDAHDDLPEDDDQRAGCWVCYPHLSKYTSAKRAHLERVPGRKNMSHASCDHPKTPSARAKCRKSQNTR